MVERSELEPGLLERLVNRGSVELASAIEKVRGIIAEVKERGDEALRKYSRLLDGVEAEEWSLEVGKGEVEEAYRSIDEEGLRALRVAIENVKEFHRAMKPTSSSIKIAEGLVAGRLVKPLKRVGVYVPKGRAGYPSTAVMTIVPAKVAGVGEVIVCTPPLKDGRAPPLTLVAAIEAGADRVFKVGGAQAVAAMAYGTQSVPKVEKIVGPGGVYVTAAKLAVSLDVAIDLPAGPSEVVVLADEADPLLIALDLLAQAEHGPGSMAILVTTSRKLAEEVAKEVGKRCPPSEASSERRLAIVVEDVVQAVELINELAPEHVELVVKDPLKALRLLRNAGAVFLGPYSAAALGDYVAGPSHVLPTGGYAKAFSGLSCRDFVKEVSFVSCLPRGLSLAGRAAVKLARLEGFEFHALSIEERLKRVKEER
ncbi:MAG: histidinol dehydrogenase [Candidatus Nezhaarchaeota archaeon]|nr:histidinol dehydrogenase [Candidatus Nezhaarchaeota archaeon]